MEGCSSHVNFACISLVVLFVFCCFFFYLDTCWEWNRLKSWLLLVLNECDKSWLPILFHAYQCDETAKWWTLFSIRNGTTWTINRHKRSGECGASVVCESESAFFLCCLDFVQLWWNFKQSATTPLNKRVSIWHCSWKIDVHDGYRLVLNHSSQVSDMQTAFSPKTHRSGY